jgi:hypothetical protein
MGFWTIISKIIGLVLINCFLTDIFLKIKWKLLDLSVDGVRQLIFAYFVLKLKQRAHVLYILEVTRSKRKWDGEHYEKKPRFINLFDLYRIFKRGKIRIGKLVLSESRLTTSLRTAVGVTIGSIFFFVPEMSTIVVPLMAIW